MKKVLVIGGSGFIGSNIIDCFKERNVDVANYSRKSNRNDVTTYEGNILNDDNFENIISNYDVIIYLITTVSPKKSMEEPNSAYVNDVPLLIKTLESCVKNGVKRVIFASSGGTIYGETYGVPANEDAPKFPINNYAICKLTCEYILEMYNKLHSMENISLRISNPYGNGQNPASGVGVITTFVDKICNGEEINLYGDGSNIRDFVDVRDVAEAFWLATNWKFDKNVTPIFNVGSGQGLSLNQIIRIIESTLNVTPIIKYFPERDFDVKTSILNVDKARNVLGYATSINEIDNIRNYILDISHNYDISLHNTGGRRR
jgi:UDP-glucose 4-epimerase